MVSILALPVRLRSIVRLVATGGYGCDDLFGKGLMPEPMLFDELLQGLQLLRFGGRLAARRWPAAWGLRRRSRAAENGSRR